MVVNAQSGEIIRLGVAGENRATQVAFDITKEAQAYPGGHGYIVAQKGPQTYMPEFSMTEARKCTIVIKADGALKSGGHYFFQQQKGSIKGYVVYFKIPNELELKQNDKLEYDPTTANGLYILTLTRNISGNTKTITCDRIFTADDSTGEVLSITKNDITQDYKNLSYEEVTLEQLENDEDTDSNLAYYLIWDVTSYDTSSAYLGKCYLHYIHNDIIKKSEIYDTIVTNSLDENEEPEAPNELTWVTEVLNKAATIEDALENTSNTETNVTRMHEEIEGWQSTVNEKHDEVVDLHGEVVDLHDKVVDLHGDVKKWHGEVESLHGEVETWHSNVEAAEKATQDAKTAAETAASAAKQSEDIAKEVGLYPPQVEDGMWVIAQKIENEEGYEYVKTNYPASFNIKKYFQSVEDMNNDWNNSEINIGDIVASGPGTGVSDSKVSALYEKVSENEGKWKLLFSVSGSNGIDGQDGISMTSLEKKDSESDSTKTTYEVHMSDGSILGNNVVVHHGNAGIYLNKWILDEDGNLILNPIEETEQ